MSVRDPVHQFKSPPPVEHHDNLATIAELKARNLWGPVVLGVAQRHGILPRHLFDADPSIIEARNEAWSELLDSGIGRPEIARWWRVSAATVRSGICSHRHEDRLANEVVDDETKPGMVRGRGEKHEECERYEACLTTFARTSGFHARCPDACSAYKTVAIVDDAAPTIIDALRLPIVHGSRARRSTDYLKQREAPSVCAQARPKGAGI